MDAPQFANEVARERFRSIVCLITKRLGLEGPGEDLVATLEQIREVSPPDHHSLQEYVRLLQTWSQTAPDSPAYDEIANEMRETTRMFQRPG